MEFIPLAEETGLILTIGDWILKSACIQLMKWMKAGYLSLKLSVNISMRQFLDPELNDKVKAALAATLHGCNRYLALGC